MTEPEFVALGQHQEVTGARQIRAENRLDELREYAVKAGTHLWGVYVMHQATDQLLDSYDGKRSELPMLDADTILMRPMVGCFVCEQSYESRLRLRRCPGEPR